MRVLVVRPGPNFSVADVSNGWVKALRDAGCDVVDFNLDDRLNFYEQAAHERDGEYHKMLDTMSAVRLANKGLEAALYEFWPDVLLVISGFYVHPDVFQLARSRGHKVVLLHTESPYEDEKQLERAEWVNVNVVNDPTNIDRYPDGTIYLPHAYDPDIHHSRTPDPDHTSDFCFVGTGYPSRIEFFERVDWRGIDTVLAGNWQKVDDDSPLIPMLAHDRGLCIDNADAAQLYAATKVSANLYRREAQHAGLVAGWSMGPREVELAACQTFYLTEARGENREVLPMVPTFDGPSDFTEKLHWFLARPESRERIACQAAAAVADRTFHNHARRLLEMLDRVPSGALHA